MYDGGKMDGADLIPVTCNLATAACPPPTPQFKFVNSSEVPYFQMAEEYAFGDRMFQTNQGPSFPAHQFIISGTSAPTPTSKLFASDNPAGAMGSSNNTGCTAPSTEFVRLIDPTGAESSTQYPCFDHPTLTDLLDAKGLSWRYYTLNAGTVSGGSIWTGPNAIQRICQPKTVGGQLVCRGSEWKNNVIIDPTRALTDVANHQLAAVSWVIPSRNDSDHAGSVSLGRIHRECGRRQFLLVEYGHYHHVG
ncbi:MAG: hypothetical protein DMG77_09360 [Acidobacteria bacterium]|nr:MAG: hypothetical protein DMG77_09360 [Acidobacteriota bacterium]